MSLIEAKPPQSLEFHRYLIPATQQALSFRRWRYAESRLIAREAQARRLAHQRKLDHLHPGPRLPQQGGPSHG
jgi:hypothetical protein